MSSTNYSGTQLGNYLLAEKLGEGGMGAVYRAEQVTLQREVAVKVLPRGLSKNADFVARFKREAETVAKLDQHPNIISILDYDTTDDAVSYVVMPLLEGGTLSERLQNGPPFDLPQVADMLRKIAGALQFAHNHGIVHRDIKPDNIMFDKFGTPMVTDFGIAKIVSVDVTTLTGQGMTVGTPLYMAPEQWKSEAIGPYTDQYALAVVVYMLVTGKAPFSSSTPQGMMYKHLEQPPQSVLEISDRLPAALDVVLMQALHKQPNGRFPHVVAFAEAFERAVKSPESFYQTRSTPLPPTNADLLQTRTPHTPLPNYPGYSPTPLPRNATPLPTAATPLPLGTPSQPEIQVATQRSWLLVAAAALLLLLLAGAAVVVTGGGGDNGGNGNDSGAAVADDIVGEDETQTTVALNALAGTDDPTATTTATATERSAAEPTEVVEDIAASPTPNPSQAPSDTPTPEPSITATPPLTDTPAPTGEPVHTSTPSTSPHAANPSASTTNDRSSASITRDADESSTPNGRACPPINPRSPPAGNPDASTRTAPTSDTPSTRSRTRPVLNTFTRRNALWVPLTRLCGSVLSDQTPTQSENVPPTSTRMRHTPPPFPSTTLTARARAPSTPASCTSHRSCAAASRSPRHRPPAPATRPPAARSPARAASRCTR